MEEWRPVAGYEDTLEVSNMGAIRTKGRYINSSRNGNPHKKSCPSTVLAQWKSNNGYMYIAPQFQKVRKKLAVHRLVAIAFVDGYASRLTVNHINGNKTDNRAGNLEWLSLSENTVKQWQTGLVNLKGENHPSHKLSQKQVLYIRRLLKQGVPGHTLAVIAGVSDALIYLIRDGKRWPDLITS